MVRDSLMVQITEKIQEMILSNNLKPGTRLPSERDLARLFGVNRATIGESINMLEERGIVTKRQGSGTYVTDIPHAVVADSIARFYLFTNCSHEELMELRELHEPEIASLAARKATPEDLAKLEELIAQIDIDATEGGIDPEVDTDFHEALAAATHNTLIIAISAGLHQVLRKWLQAQYEGELNVPALKGRGAIARRKHRMVYDAVVSGDPKRARTAMKDHMRFIRTSFMKQSRLKTKF